MSTIPFGLCGRITTTDDLMEFVEELKLQMQFNQHMEARRLVKRAVKSGELVRPTQCSSDAPEHEGRIEAHHTDYSRPLDVVWLCVSCHRKTDRLRLFGW